ncbi:hypothetical protein Ahy_B09g098336 [Arachis hypogaea]|uniref:Uncharacterized protein n=1 Tax=Arachis hypogaea TaxID=3818 RepID=A0A444XRL4_ARAHY|nr:hypothetical protein Ahy_B09g098336 [Arachis hypogaea]
MENNQYFFVVVYSNGIVRHDDEGEFFESDNTVMLHTYRVDILDALKTVMLSNMGGVGTKEVGRVAYRFLYVLPNGGFTNRLFWIDGDHHVRVMFGVHAGLMPQHVMELYAAVHDVVVGMDSLLQLLKSCRSRRHRPHDSADDSDSEDNSTYVAGSGSSSDTMSEDEFVPETPNGSVAYMRLRPVPVIALPMSTCPGGMCSCEYGVGSFRGPRVHDGLCIQAIPDEKMWPPWYGARLKSNSAMRGKASGRPVSTWIQMDAIERAEKRCGLCRREGHTRRGCPNAPYSDPR